MCIGCAYCAVACPYQARYKTDLAAFAYGAKPTANEALRHDDARRSVATKCTFCVDRIDAGLEQGLTPGVDPDATPACVNSCIAEALAFGDIEDPKSNVSQLLAQEPALPHARGARHRAGLLLPWDRNPDMSAAYGPNPWQQAHWDWRAAGNFICGGAGGGLSPSRCCRGVSGVIATLLLLAGLGLVGLGLLCVWLEIGRPLRALNVFLNPRTSWMSREALVSVLLFRLGLGLLVGRCAPGPRRSLVAALAFVYCQARIVQAARGIPAWREPLTVPLLVATGAGRGRRPVLAGHRCRAPRRLRCSLAVWRAGAGALAAVAGLAQPHRPASAAPRALARASTRGPRLQWLGGAVPLALIALARVRRSSPAPGARCCWRRPALLVAATGAHVQVHADHPGRVQPGLRPDAAAGARRARADHQPTSRRPHGCTLDSGNRARAGAGERSLPARGVRDDAARAAGAAAARAAAGDGAERLRQRAADRAAAARPTARGRPTSAAWRTSRCCRSPSRPTCATSIPSACSRGPATQLARLHASSGTTGKPTVVGYTREDLDNWADLMARSLYSAGVRRGDVVHNAYGYGLFTGGLGAHYGAERLGAVVVPVSGGSTERQVALIMDFNARGAVRHAVLRAGHRRGRRAAGRRPAQERAARSACSAPSPGAPRCAARSRRGSGLKAVDVYGLSEIMGPGVACECECQDGLHGWEDHFLFEVIDPETGRRCPRARPASW